MSKILDNIKDFENNVQDKIQGKLKRGEILTDGDLKAYKLTSEDMEMMDILGRMQDGETIPGFDIKDFLASPAAKVLIPKVIIGQARKAADPVYLASNFYKKINLKNGQAVIFPEFGVMRAYDVAEGQEFPQEEIDWQLNTNNMIKVGKSGLRIQYSEELFKDTEFDIVDFIKD